MLGTAQHPLAEALARPSVPRVRVQPLGGCEQDVPARTEMNLASLESCAAHPHPESCGPTGQDRPRDGRI